MKFILIDKIYYIEKNFILGIVKFAKMYKITNFMLFTVIAQNKLLIILLKYADTHSKSFLTIKKNNNSKSNMFSFCDLFSENKQFSLQLFKIYIFQYCHIKIKLPLMFFLNIILLIRREVKKYWFFSKQKKKKNIKIFS